MYSLVHDREPIFLSWAIVVDRATRSGFSDLDELY